MIRRWRGRWQIVHKHVCPCNAFERQKGRRVVDCRWYNIVCVVLGTAPFFVVYLIPSHLIDDTPKDEFILCRAEDNFHKISVFVSCRFNFGSSFEIWFKIGAYFPILTSVTDFNDLEQRIIFGCCQNKVCVGQFESSRLDIGLLRKVQGLLCLGFSGRRVECIRSNDNNERQDDKKGLDVCFIAMPLPLSNSIRTQHSMLQAKIYVVRCWWWRIVIFVDDFTA